MKNKVKFGVNQITKSTPTWSFVLQMLFLVTLPTLLKEVPNMPITEVSKYWMNLGITLAIPIGVGFLQMFGIEQVTE